MGGWPKASWRSVGLRDALNHGEDLNDQRLRRECPGEKNTGRGPGGDQGGLGRSD